MKYENHELAALRAELAALRAELAALRAAGPPALPDPTPAPPPPLAGPPGHILTGTGIGIDWRASVPLAGHAGHAGHADTADLATEAELAFNAESASYADTAGHADTANTATNADTVDGFHAATAGAHAHVLATTSAGNARIDGTLSITNAKHATIYATADTANSPFITVSCDAGNAFISSNKIGSASVLPFRIYTSGSPRLTITPDGQIGLGISSPKSRLHIRDTIAGSMFWQFDGLTDTAQTILPDESGDILYIARLMVVVRDSAGSVAANNYNITPGAEITITTSTGNSIAIRVNTNGSMDARRTAGSLTFKVALWAVWL